MFDIDLRPLIVLAVVGLVALLIAIPFGLYWLWSHVSVVIR